VVSFHPLAKADWLSTASFQVENNRSKAKQDGDRYFSKKTH
jgi:hypothetical protein